MKVWVEPLSLTQALIFGGKFSLINVNNVYDVILQELHVGYC